MRKTRFLCRWLAYVLLAGLLSGCGGGGGNGDDGSDTVPNHWDRMLWDQGLWQ